MTASVLESGSWGLWATALTGLGLGLFVYAKNRSGPMNQAWLRLSLAVGLWASATGSMLQASDAGWAMGWARVAQAAFSFIPVLLLHFNLILLNGNGHRQGLLRWSYRAAGLFAVLGLTPLMIRDLQTELSFRHYPVAGPLFGIFSVWFLGSLIASLWVLLEGYRSEVGTRRNQLRYMILACLIGLFCFFSMIPLAFGGPFAPLGQGLRIFYHLFG